MVYHYCAIFVCSKLAIWCVYLIFNQTISNPEPHIVGGVYAIKIPSHYTYTYIYVYIYSIYVLLCYIHHVIPMMFQSLIHINYIYI